MKDMSLFPLSDPVGVGGRYFPPHSEILIANKEYFYYFVG